jgi:hypothetical protein
MKTSMSMRARILASALASLLVATGFVVANPAAASAASCYKTKKSTVYLHGIGNEYEFLTHYTQSGQVVVDPREPIRTNVKTGNVSVTILACKKNKTAAWKALDYSISTNLLDLKLVITGKKVNPVPADNDRGFGMMIQRVTAKTVEFQPLICVKKPSKLSFLGAVKFVTGLPLPVSLQKAIGLYVVNNALKEQDDKYQCGLLGKVTGVPFAFTSSGVAKLKMPSTGHYLFNRRATWQESCPPDIYCGVSHDEVLEVRAGK